MPDLVTYSNNRSDSLPGYLPKVAIQIFFGPSVLVIAFVYLVPEMYSCCVLFENIIEMRVFNVICL